MSTRPVFQERRRLYLLANEAGEYPHPEYTICTSSMISNTLIADYKGDSDVGKSNSDSEEPKGQEPRPFVLLPSYDPPPLVHKCDSEAWYVIFTVFNY